jgi:hypothetical protein
LLSRRALVVEIVIVQKLYWLPTSLILFSLSIKVTTSLQSWWLLLSLLGHIVIVANLEGELCFILLLLSSSNASHVQVHGTWWSSSSLLAGTVIFVNVTDFIALASSILQGLLSLLELLLLHGDSLTDVESANAFSLGRLPARVTSWCVLTQETDATKAWDLDFLLHVTAERGDLHSMSTLIGILHILAALLRHVQVKARWNLLILILWYVVVTHTSKI